jgi:hypothetical protein
MKIHHLAVEEAFASVRSGPEGLPAAEAARRLAEYGPNAVERVRRESLALRSSKDSPTFSPSFSGSLVLHDVVEFLQNILLNLNAEAVRLRIAGLCCEIH